MADEGRQSLTVNYRSQPAILDFINGLLEQDIANYETLVPHVRQITAAPSVEFLWTDVADDTDVTTRRQLKAQTIARRIRQMISKKEKLASKREAICPSSREVEPRDIVLLFRAMTNVGIYEAALEEATLDYYVVGGRAFYARQEIYDVLNLLQAIGNPLDSLAASVFGRRLDASVMKAFTCCRNRTRACGRH